MTDPRRIPRVRRPLDARFEAPPSKSATHRALVLAALGNGPSRLHRPLDAEDTRVTRDGLAALGIRSADVGTSWRIDGLGGRIPGGGTIDLRESGTSCRFLVALAALGERATRLDGSPRLRERPLAQLVDALRTLGADVRCEREEGRLPLRAGGRRPRGGALSLPELPSSQVVSGLLLAGCRLEGGLRLVVAPPHVSAGYVAMTVEMLREAGIAVEASGDAHLVGCGVPAVGDRTVEGDDSSASYLLAAGALLGTAEVTGLRRRSLQPDARLRTVLRTMGCAVEETAEGVRVSGGDPLQPIDLDLSGAPDLAPTAAVLAAFAGGTSRLRGLRHLRVKESDRLRAIADNLQALGVTCRATDDALDVEGRPDGPAGPCTVRTFGDHRIAMAFAVAGMRTGGVTIDDPSCVAKSFPGFWDAIGSIA